MSTWSRAKPKGNWQGKGGQQRERRDNSLAVFPNERRRDDNDPDFTGQGLVNGVEFWVSLWVKRSNKTGEEFFSLSLRPKEEARRGAAPSRYRDEEPPRRPTPQTKGRFSKWRDEEEAEGPDDQIPFEDRARPVTYRDEAPPIEAYQDEPLDDHWEREP